MVTNKEIGAMGEDIAAHFLTKKGYNILCRNFRCKHGEIDMVARIRGTYVFIEVKTRNSLAFGQAMESVNWQKQKKIKSCALWYLSKHHLVDANVRFDVIEVYNIEDKESQINHLQGAF